MVKDIRKELKGNRENKKGTNLNDLSKKETRRLGKLNRSALL